MFLIILLFAVARSVEVICTWGPAQLDMELDGEAILATDDVKYFSDVSSVEECESICDGFDECSGATWNHQNNRCWIKDGATTASVTDLTNRESALKVCTEVTNEPSFCPVSSQPTQAPASQPSHSPVTSQPTTEAPVPLEETTSVPVEVESTTSQETEVPVVPSEPVPTTTDNNVDESVQTDKPTENSNSDHTDEQPYFAVEGDCDIQGDCVSSTGYPTQYRNNEDCTVTLLKTCQAHPADIFDLEPWNDFLRYESKNIGDYSVVPEIMIEGEHLYWSSDHDTTHQGWQICFSDLDIDCDGSWSACTAACEVAADRIWTSVAEQSGLGAVCPEAVDCAYGESECLAPLPSSCPSSSPTSSPSRSPTSIPSTHPSSSPTSSPSSLPTPEPTPFPTLFPSRSPTNSVPTVAPTGIPTNESPSISPTRFPTSSPTSSPNSAPSTCPTSDPTSSPTTIPTPAPKSIDCEGSWGECTEACESAEDRVWTSVAETAGLGSACPETEDCLEGDGMCGVCTDPNWWCDAEICSSLCHSHESCPCTCESMPTRAPTRAPSMSTCEEQPWCLDVPCEEVCDLSQCQCSCHRSTVCSEDVPCKNGGVCLNGECYCNDHFSGELCEIGYAQCGTQRCYNGGVCNSDTKCACPAPYIGYQCTDILEGSGHQWCTVDSCLNGGTCYLGTGMCTCPNGWHGATCEDFDGSRCTDTSCMNEGVCNHATGLCLCPHQWTGASCETDMMDPCYAVTCVNGGVCASGSCLCPKNWTGEQCETADLCSEITCQNGGACNAGVCVCESGWTGTYCETADLCFGIICQNSGTCSPLNGMCECSYGWTGTYCETADDVLDCPMWNMGSNSCSNGVFSVTSGVVSSVQTFSRPLSVEAEIRSSQHSECVDMTLFASGNGKNDEISFEIGAWANQWRFFPGDNRGSSGDVTSFRKIKVELDCGNEVRFYLDDALIYTTSSSLSSGYIKFPKGCVNSEVRNVRVVQDSAECPSLGADYTHISAVECYVNSGGCYNEGSISSCKSRCDNDPQCLMFEMDITSESQTPSQCCLEYCYDESSCSAWRDDGIKCTGKGAMDWSSWVKPTAESTKNPACTRPSGWCTHSGATYSIEDCDGDGILDPVCRDTVGYVGVLSSGNHCIDSWPTGTCLAPASVCVPQDSDSCLQVSSGWSTSYSCSSSTQWCNSYDKDMQRCCPESCGTAVLTEAECNSKSGSGTCTYPNDAQCPEGQPQQGYTHITGVECYVNSGGCYGEQSIEACQSRCDNDPQCLMFEMDITSETQSPSNCCLEYCNSASTCSAWRDDGVKCNDKGAIDWSSWVKPQSPVTYELVKTGTCVSDYTTEGSDFTYQECADRCTEIGCKYFTRPASVGENADANCWTTIVGHFTGTCNEAIYAKETQQYESSLLFDVFANSPVAMVFALLGTLSILFSITQFLKNQKKDYISIEMDAEEI